ncbi:MAG: hypothetical protein DYG89_04180 [Caldilinea sp. CFX5]|nr:hypothetical protein [Caldilinea sp. CFX5]
MLINLHSIIVDKPIPGLTGVTFNKCTTLADVLAALITQGGADIHATGGNYDPATENIRITLSNGSSFTIPASLLLPVVADGVTITGNGTNANKLTGYKIAYDATSGALTITPPTGAPVTVPAQTATEEKAADPHNLLGLGAGATVTTQQMLDYLAAHLHDCCSSDTQEIPANAFADPVNPTQMEAQAWIDNHGPFKAGTQIIYNRFVNGDVEDPDYVWLVNEIGDATNVESPEPIKAGAGLINATATGLTQNVAKNPAFSQIAYQQNAAATTGANSNITVQFAGRYLVTASVWWASETWLTECGIHGFINVNGTMVYAGGRLDHSRKLQTDPVNSGNSKFLAYTTALTCILSLNAGDVVTFTLIHDDNTSHNLLTTSGYSWFQVEKLS